MVEIAYPGRDGAFAMNLSPGDYVLKAFFAGKQVGKPVAVTVKGPQLVDLREPFNVSASASGDGAADKGAADKGAADK